MEVKALIFLKVMSYIFGITMPDPKNKKVLSVFIIYHALVWIIVLSANFYFIDTFAASSIPHSVRNIGIVSTILHVLVNFSTSLNLIYFRRKHVQRIHLYLWQRFGEIDDNIKCKMENNIYFLIGMILAFTSMALPFARSWRHCVIFLNKATISLTVMTLCSHMIFFKYYIQSLNEELYRTLTLPVFWIHISDKKYRYQMVLNFSRRYSLLYSLLESANAVYGFIFLSFSCLIMTMILFFCNVLMKFVHGILPVEMWRVINNLVECVIYLVSFYFFSFEIF